MAIKVSVGEQKTQVEKEFPKLMIANKTEGSDLGVIVLFEQAGSGTVIKTVEGSDKKIGYYSDIFKMECFTDYNEEITLKNE